MQTLRSVTIFFDEEKLQQQYAHTGGISSLDRAIKTLRSHLPQLRIGARVEHVSVVNVTANEDELKRIKAFLADHDIGECEIDERGKLTPAG